VGEEDDLSSELTLLEGESSYASELDSGFYTIEILLFDGENHVAGAVEAARIYAGQISSGTVYLSVDSEAGAIGFDFESSMRGALECGISAPEGALSLLTASTHSPGLMGPGVMSLAAAGIETASR